MVTSPLLGPGWPTRVRARFSPQRPHQSASDHVHTVVTVTVPLSDSSSGLHDVDQLAGELAAEAQLQPAAVGPGRGDVARADATERLERRLHVAGRRVEGQRAGLLAGVGQREGPADGVDRDDLDGLVGKRVFRRSWLSPGSRERVRRPATRCAACTISPRPPVAGVRSPA